ncbi:Cytochrome 71AV8 [Capsicum annuum]|uniref:premnaspirodiene oxygenase n=1 Tax=Capsicum annuum TaxID=4072 RepID=UPI0007BEC0D9|nr:premnaspirodiene oxygenase [Capsicum annuum]KAF3644451.1 Cytochrome 71AV8 [Capsicum annuum]
MELQHYSLSLFTFLTMLLLILTVKYLSKTIVVSKRSPTLNLPPGPWKLPIIGSIHHLIASQLPHQTLRDLAKKHGPLMHLQLGEISAIVISSPRVAQEVLKTQDIAFTNRPELLSAKILSYNYSDIAFAPYGNYWRQMRKLCTLELLSAKNVLSFASIREEEALNLVEYLESKSGSIINLTEKMYALTNAVICRAAFGKRWKEESVYFMSLIEEMSSMVTGFDISEVFPSLKFLQAITGTKAKLVKLHKEVDEMLDKIIEEHNEKLQNHQKNDDQQESLRKDDLVNLLLRLQENGNLEFPFTADNIKAVILDMFLAGTETSATVLDWAMVELMRNPKVMEKAQTELRRILKGKNKVTEIDLKQASYLKLVIKETMRLHPPLPLLLPRESREQCVINGYHIPIKTKVIVNAWAINRDAEFWEDAESFLPERFINSDSNTNMEFIGQNFEYLPFGGGRRMCPGILFGLATIELPLAQLIYYFNWKLPHGMKPEDVDVTETSGTSCRRKYNLCVIASSNDNGI